MDFSPGLAFSNLAGADDLGVLGDAAENEYSHYYPNEESHLAGEEDNVEDDVEKDLGDSDEMELADSVDMGAESEVQDDADVSENQLDKGMDDSELSNKEM